MMEIIVKFKKSLENKKMYIGEQLIVLSNCLTIV